jgi:hypothetical protein
MSAPSGTLASSRLRRLAQSSRQAREPEEPGTQAPATENCELCGDLIASEHRHLVDLSTRGLLCICRACTLLFDSRAAGGGHYRLVPDRRLRIEDFELDEALWQNLRIPVEMAFFFRSSQAERVVAFYPGPAGATESQLDLAAWRELEAVNPILGELEEDVEALLVNRAEDAHGGQWLVPIDDCYDLVGLMRTYWKGLSGGQEVWAEIRAFFERLAGRAKTVDRGNRQRSNAPAAATAGHRKEPAWGT